MNIDSLYDTLENLGYEPHVFCTGADAIDYLKSYLKNKTVAFGGSMTIKQLNLYKALQEYTKERYWHWESNDPDILKKAMTADVYITSANALTEDGMIVNMDGNGNRIAGSIFGPKEVIFIIGENKITPDLKSAYLRIKKIAAPLNAKRLGKNTPCAVTGKCTNCMRPDSFCCVLCIHMRKPASIKGTVLLIRENLGY